MSPERITSRRNPLLQQVRRLLSSPRDRLESGLFVGDGTKLLEEAVRWDGGLEAVILTDTLRFRSCRRRRRCTRFRRM